MKKTVSFNAVAEPFGSPDGTTNEFQLAYQGQKLIRPSYLNVTAMHQTDWQGRLALSNQPRTNWIPFSAVTNNYPAGISIATGQPDPKGGTAGIKFTATANQSAGQVGMGVYWLPSSGVPASGACNWSLWIKASRAGIQLQVGTNGAGGTILVDTTGAWQLVYGSSSFVAGDALQVYGSGYGSGSQMLAIGDSIAMAFGGEYQGASQPVIPTTSAPVILTDYAVDSSGNVTLGQDPVAKATLDWDGSATCDFVDASATFLSQYATAPIITSLIQTANAAIDPQADFEGFLANVWNIYTAQGFGLDIWGRIVNIPRTINIPATVAVLGFEEASDAHYYPFNQEPFYNGPTGGTLYTLTDDAYRMLILTKALANISSFTAESMNALLNFMFNGQGTTRGSCYVLETATPMQIQYVFNFALQSWEAAILEQASLMPRPAGVGITIIVNP